MSFDYIVVGGGISGAATAYYLQKSGAKVLLMEKGDLASGGTGKSAAIVRQHYSTPLMARLAKRSIDIFEAMPSELGASGGFAKVGYHLLLSPAMLDAAKANIEMQRQIGVRTSLLPNAEWSKLDWLNPEGVAGIVNEPDGGYADPVASVEAYVGAFERAGGTVRKKAACRALTRAGNRVTGIVTDDGDIAAGGVVNAAGPWARYLAESAGVALEMRTVREQDTVWAARGGHPIPTGSVSNGVDAIYLRPLGDGRFIIGRGFPKDYDDVDPYNYKTNADDSFVADVQSRLDKHLPGFAGAKLIASYASLYDVSADWYSYVGPRADIAGYFDFSGGSGHGFKIAPAMAQELAAWMTTGKVASDFAGLSYDRVKAGKLFKGSYGGNRG